MNKIFRVILISILVSMILSACAGSAPATVNPPLRLAVNLWPGLYPAAIAQEQGFFAKHNVDVTLVYYESYPQTYADLVAGKVDGVSAIVGDELVISNQLELNFIFPVDASDGADVVIAGADIQNAADLKGKRIGVSFGTYGELFVRTFLKQNGVAATDVTFVNIPPENAAEAFPSQVDAIHTYEPYASETLSKGGHTIVDSSATPNLMLGAMTLPAKLVKDRPQDMQAFTDAWFEAVDWMYANPDQVPAVVAKAFGVKPEDIWFGGDKVFTRTEAKALMQPGKDYTSAYFITQIYIDFLVKSGALNTMPDMNAMLNPSFLK